MTRPHARDVDDAHRCTYCLMCNIWVCLAEDIDRVTIRQQIGDRSCADDRHGGARFGSILQCESDLQITVTTSYVIRTSLKIPAFDRFPVTDQGIQIQ